MSKYGIYFAKVAYERLGRRKRGRNTRRKGLLEAVWKKKMQIGAGKLAWKWRSTMCNRLYACARIVSERKPRIAQKSLEKHECKAGDMSWLEKCMCERK